METLHKVISVITVLACIAGLSWSCTNDGIVSAHAEDLGMFYDAKEFYHTFTEELEEVTHNAAQSINDSNLSQAQKDAILKVLAMQEIALHAMNSDYDGDNVPSGDTIIISGSTYAGYYRYHNELNPCFVYPVPKGQDFNSGQHYTIASAPDFQVDLVFNKHNDSDRFYSVNNSSQIRVTPDFGSFTYTDVMNSGFFADSSVNFYQTNSTGWYTNTSTYPIPTYSDGSNSPLWKYCYTNSSLQAYFCGGATETTIPEAEVDSEKPWDYYNNHLLPEIYNDFPDVDVTYICFPDGYQHEDPVEPPSLPSGGIGVQNNWNFNIGVNIIYPTDSDGQPVTDASGETVTETEIITDTRPTDAVYNFQIPTLTPLETQVATIPPYRVPAEYAGYMGDVFSSITTFIDDAGLSDIAPVFLALAGIGIVIGVLL